MLLRMKKFACNLSGLTNFNLLDIMPQSNKGTTLKKVWMSKLKSVFWDVISLNKLRLERRNMA
ncbi:hypothetical protein GALL_186310 [mine drainage metagenome]|uniref:Uncharacterized protein n=1 Tax=mine drainage metagenome TaxID=410659 RepID=A0A1J5RUG7_9ZZZZ